jgi:ADP-ribosylglycohydrolase
MGFIKHAFILSFYFLIECSKRELSYARVIREVVSLGGDADTNACIAGALIGALVGFDGLDESMVKTVLSCSVSGEGHERPDWLSVGKTAIPNI